MSARIITPEVQQARNALITELRKSIQAAGVTRDTAEAQLSSIFCGLWNEAEVFVSSLPATDGRRRPKS